MISLDETKHSSIRNALLSCKFTNGQISLGELVTQGNHFFITKACQTMTLAAIVARWQYL
jgi:hypothetical protein